MIGGDLKTENGIKSLNDYLADKSYIEGFQPSQADSTVFSALSGSPNAKYPHALRWYNQINSYGKEISSFPGVKKDLSAFVTTAQKSAASKPAPADKQAAGYDDDLDLFGSDDDAEAERVKEERVKQYQDKKAKKPGVIAKSTVLLDVKPWDDETDMAEMEKRVRAIVMDGLMWGASKLIPLAYGIKKLQIVTVVEDEKVSIDLLQEEIEKIEDLVQSVDIAAFQKI